MPHALSMTDGSTTVSLSTTNCLLEHYVPQTPKRIGPGELDFAPVTEPIEVAFVGASTGAIQAAINGVERLLLAAERRARTGVGARVFLQYQPIGDGTLWRSEVYGGGVGLAESAMTTFGSLITRARLTVTRASWWEGSRTQIPLTNGNGSNNTSGLTIYNHDDGDAGHDNYLEISAGSVAGVVPSPVELQLTNNNGATVAINAFYLANNIFDTSFSHIVEGEAQASGGSDGSAGTCSGGQFLSLAFTGTGTAQWNLVATQMKKTQGRYFHLLARMPFFALAPGTYVKASIRDNNGLVVLATMKDAVKLTLGTAYLQYLGTLPLPPGGFNDDYGIQRLVLEFSCAVSETINLDFIQLTPADELCYREVVARDTGHEAGTVFVDDGIEGSTYKILSGNNDPIYAPKGRPLHVFPGVNQRIYVLMDGVDATIDKTMTAQAWYRPRRLTV